MNRATPTVAPGVRGFDPVLAAEAAEGAGGDSQRLAGILVTGVDASHAFESFSGDLFHHIPRYWMHVLSSSIQFGLSGKKERLQTLFQSLQPCRRFL
jgi:hypothetical protein